MGPRRKAREYALQMLFQWDITRDSIDQIAATFFNGQDEEPGVIAFARQLVIQTVGQVEDMDALLHGHAEHWRVDRMATVDRILVRYDSQEFLLHKGTPNSVLMNEAI